MLKNGNIFLQCVTEILKWNPEMNKRNRLAVVIFFAAITVGLLTAYSPVKEFNVKAPELKSEQWLNSGPLNWSMLKDKVVLVEFWTFDCYNCKNVEPYVKSWYDKYKNRGLEIVAVHTPEFDHEKKLSNVKEYIADHGITYPVAIDNDFIIWRSYSNRYWPAMYIVDKKGTVRFRFIGEGNYKLIEQTLVKLLNETG